MTLLAFTFITALVIFIVGVIPTWAVIKMWEDLSLSARFLALACLIVVYLLLIVDISLFLIHNGIV